MPLLVSLILITIVDGVVNVSNNCTSVAFIAISAIMALLIGTVWSILIYKIQPELTYHTDYITTNKLACSMPSKQKFKCVVKKTVRLLVKFRDIRIKISVKSFHEFIAMIRCITSFSHYI